MEKVSKCHAKTKYQLNSQHGLTKSFGQGRAIAADANLLPRANARLCYTTSVKTMVPNPNLPKGSPKFSPKTTTSFTHYSQCFFAHYYLIESNMSIGTRAGMGTSSRNYTVNLTLTTAFTVFKNSFLQLSQELTSIILNRAA